MTKAQLEWEKIERSFIRYKILYLEKAIREVKSGNPYYDNKGRFNYSENTVAIAKKNNAILVKDVFSIPSNEFEFPSNNYVLPPICTRARKLIGLTDKKRVLLKKEVLKRQTIYHREIGSPFKNMATIYNALYETTDKIYRNSKNKHYYYALAECNNGEYYCSVIDTDPSKDYIEIVDWRIVREKAYIQMKNQESRSGGTAISHITTSQKAIGQPADEFSALHSDNTILSLQTKKSTSNIARLEWDRIGRTLP